MKRITSLITLFATLAAAGSTHAANISWYTVDGGGADVPVSASFDLRSTIGQPDAGLAMASASFTVVGGYWSATDADAEPCVGDLNGDNVVDLTDLGIMLGNYGTGTTAAEGDLNGDNMVDLTDLGILLSHYAEVCP